MVRYVAVSDIYHMVVYRWIRLLPIMAARRVCLRMKAHAVVLHQKATGMSHNVFALCSRRLTAVCGGPKQTGALLQNFRFFARP